MKIRDYTDSDLDAVLECFARSVREIGGRYYSPRQIEAWAPASLDRGAWTRRLNTGGVFIAQLEGALAGFVRVEADGWVDLLYVHPAFERRGVGRKLIQTAQSWAEDQGAHRLAAAVSLAARPFFEAMGFEVEEEQVVERNGIQFTNFRMGRRVGRMTPPV